MSLDRVQHDLKMLRKESLHDVPDLDLLVGNDSSAFVVLMPIGIILLIGYISTLL